MFQVFLDEMAKAIPKKEGVRQLLIVDNASWHRAARVQWHHFEPKFLPGYSPDFNPIERLWLRLKADWFWDFFARTPQELTDRLCVALRSFIDLPAKTASICSIQKRFMATTLEINRAERSQSRSRTTACWFVR